MRGYKVDRGRNSTRKIFLGALVNILLACLTGEIHIAWGELHLQSQFSYALYGLGLHCTTCYSSLGTLIFSHPKQHPKNLRRTLKLLKGPGSSLCLQLVRYEGCTRRRGFGTSRKAEHRSGCDGSDNPPWPPSPGVEKRI
jgi:hypothetical protein